MSSRDGIALHGEWFAHRSPRAGALIVHGYAEHCGRYRETANALTMAGLSVLSFDLRGHGRSAGPRGLVRAFTDYLDDIDTAVAELEDRVGSAPLFMLAHSNGALAALRLLADPWRAPKRVQAAVLCSPFLRLRAQVSRAKQLLSRIGGRVLPSLTMPSGLKPEWLTHDPDKLNERRHDTLCHDVASARWFTEGVAHPGLGARVLPSNQNSNPLAGLVTRIHCAIQQPATRCSSA